MALGRRPQSNGFHTLLRTPSQGSEAWRDANHTAPGDTRAGRMAPRRKPTHAPLNPTQGPSRWMNGWPYRVFACGKVKVGTAKVGPHAAWSFSLFSYEGADYECHQARDQCVRLEMQRRGIGYGPGAFATCPNKAVQQLTMLPLPCVSQAVAQMI